MARQQSLFPYSGKLRDIIGYERNGKHFVRRMPEAVRQTPATRNAAQRFGLASKKGALIRHTFYEDLDLRCDCNHVNRLNKAFIRAGGNNESITGFRFNEHTGVDRFFTKAPKLFRNEVLHLPRQTLTFGKNITQLEVKVIAARIDFNTLVVTGKETVRLVINSRDPFEGTHIPLNVPGEGTLVVTLQVIGMHRDCPSANRQYLAADIVAIATPAMPDNRQQHSYPPQTTIQSATTLNTAHSQLTVIQRE